MKRAIISFSNFSPQLPAEAIAEIYRILPDMYLIRVDRYVDVAKA